MDVPGALRSIATFVSFGLLICACGGSTTSPSQPVVTMLAITGAAPTVGSTGQFTATATFSGGATQDVTAQSTWSSSNTAVATVSTSGIVTALAAGDVDIRVTYQNFTGSKTVTIVSNAPCTFALSTTVIAMRESVGSATVTVTPSSANCSWTAVANSPFITIDGGGVWTGAATVTLSVTANLGGSRSGTVTIAGQTVTVNQDAAGSCVSSISPTSQNFGENGPAPGSISVSAPADCSWTAITNASFLTVTGGASGIGNGVVSYSVANNPANMGRSGTISIGTKTFTVTQDARPCVITVSPTSLSLSPREWGNPEDPLFITITTSATGCGWTTASNVPWIVLPTQSGVGGGGSAVEVAQNNSGSTRTGTITVTGQTIPVAQTSYAQLALSFSATTVGASATSITFTVVPSGGTDTGFWFVTTSSPFLHVRNPCISRFDCAGSKSGSIDIDANLTGSMRTGTVTLTNGRANLILPLVTYVITQSGQ